MDFKPYWNITFSNYLAWAIEIINDGKLFRYINENQSINRIILTDRNRDYLSYYNNVKKYPLGSHNPMLDCPEKLSKIIFENLDEIS